MLIYSLCILIITAKNSFNLFALCFKETKGTYLDILFSYYKYTHVPVIISLNQICRRPTTVWSKTEQKFNSWKDRHAATTPNHLLFNVLLESDRFWKRTHVFRSAAHWV